MNQGGCVFEHEAMNQDSHFFELEAMNQDRCFFERGSPLAAYRLTIAEMSRLSEPGAMSSDRSNC